MDNPIVVQKTKSLMCTHYDMRIDKTPKFNYQTDLYTKDGVVSFFARLVYFLGPGERYRLVPCGRGSRRKFVLRCCLRGEKFAEGQFCVSL